MIENTNTKQFYPGPILNNTLEITDFLFNDAEQIKIKHSKLNEEGILIDIDLNYPTDYEVTKVLPSDINAAEAALTASTGQIMLKNVNVSAGEKLTVYRVSQIIQDKDYPRTGAFPAATHEGALDYLTMQNQEQKDDIDRALKVPISTEGFSGNLPVPIPSRALKINNDGTGFEMSEFDPDLVVIMTEDFKNQAQQAATDALSSQTAAASSETIASQAAEVAKESAERLSGTGLPIGSVFQAIRTDVPINSLRLDGTEYTAGFEDFVEKFLAAGKIISKSLDEWQTEYTMTNGNVGFFGYDETIGAFKTPSVQAGTFLAQAFASGQFGSFLNSELKAHDHVLGGYTSVDGNHAHNRGTMEISGNLYGAALGADGAFYPTGESGDGSGDYNPQNVGFLASRTWVGETSYNGAHGHTLYGSTQPTGGADTYPKHIRYPFFVVVANAQSEQTAQVDWDNFVGNLDGKANKSFTNLDTQAEKHFLNKQQITNCILEAPNGVVTYSGNTITAKAGLKVLAPDGLNSDGTYKNVEFTLQQDISRSFYGNGEFVMVINSSGLFELWYRPFVYIQENAPTSNQDYVFWLDTINNQWKYKSPTNRNWYTTDGACAIIGLETNTETELISVTPYQPIQLLKRADKAEISTFGMPSNRFDTLAIGAAGTTYIAPAHGYFHFFCCPGAAGYAQAAITNISKDFIDWDGQDGRQRMLCVVAQAEKGEIVQLWYELPGGLRADSRLRFYYAKGVK